MYHLENPKCEDISVAMLLCRYGNTIDVILIITYIQQHWTKYYYPRTHVLSVYTCILGIHMSCPYTHVLSVFTCIVGIHIYCWHTHVLSVYTCRVRMYMSYPLDTRLACRHMSRPYTQDLPVDTCLVRLHMSCTYAHVLSVDTYLVRIYVLSAYTCLVRIHMSCPCTLCRPFSYTRVIRIHMSFPHTYVLSIYFCSCTHALSL
jgi:hypothetical protein